MTEPTPDLSTIPAENDGLSDEDREIQEYLAAGPDPEMDAFHQAVWESGEMWKDLD